MMGTDRTGAKIDAAMAKGEARVCVGCYRCSALASDVETARARCTPEGRCRVGAIISRGGREVRDVWLEASTGLVKLMRQSDAYAGRNRRSDARGG